MKNRKFWLYWLLALAGTIAVSYYPLYMGVRVISDMIKNGTVLKENYPKYIIPYTPISLALIAGVLLMPLFIKLFKKFALLAGGVLSVGTFFGLELLFERKVVVSSTELVETVTTIKEVQLADWQMYMCAYYPPVEVDKEVIGYVGQVRTQSAVDILIGNYNPAFKLHFYLISVVLILALLTCLYGFAQMILSGDRSRKKALILQSVSAALFLGLCILACFTAFWRDGNIYISPLSASLMAVFFILLGVTVGLFAGSMLLKQKRAVTLSIPAVLAALTTLVMYIGEMILLNAHLYRFGTGFFFDGLPGIVLAPVDILIIIASGAVTLGLMALTARLPAGAGDSAVERGAPVAGN